MHSEHKFDEFSLCCAAAAIADAVAALPEFRQTLMRRLRNRGARTENAKSFLRETLLIDNLEPYEEEFKNKTHFIRTEDIEMTETFEVLDEPENGLPVRAVVH